MLRFVLPTCFLILGCSIAQGSEPPAAIGPEEAAAKVDQQVTVAMEVKSATLKGDVCFLNSTDSFKDPKNLTLFIGKDVLAKFKAAGIDDPAAKFKGKRVRAHGKVILFKERPEIALGGPESISVVDEPSGKSSTK